MLLNAIQRVNKEDSFSFFGFENFPHKRWLQPRHSSYTRTHFVLQLEVIYENLVSGTRLFFPDDANNN